MTIASEISRLQCAKTDIRQAIIDKGVSVDASLTIDDYACCIAQIPTAKTGYVDVLVVGGGGSGGNRGGTYVGTGGSGGGGGCVRYCSHYKVKMEDDAVIGAGGIRNSSSTSQMGTGGCASSFGGINANGGLAGCFGTGCGGTSGSGRSGGIGCYANAYFSYGGGGGGECGNGTAGNCRTLCGGNGGAGVVITCFGLNECLGGGGGGSGQHVGLGTHGGGNGGGCGYNGCNATYYGGGGGGGTCGGCGCQGVVKIRYRTDGSCGINSSTGGNSCCTVTVDGVEYCVHTFTSDGTFCIVS